MHACIHLQEVVLRKELSLLSERLTKAQVESQALRSERDEMLGHIREIEAAMRGKGGKPCVAAKYGKQQQMGGMGSM